MAHAEPWTRYRLLLTRLGLASCWKCSVIMALLLGVGWARATLGTVFPFWLINGLELCVCVCVRVCVSLDGQGFEPRVSSAHLFDSFLGEGDPELGFLPPIRNFTEPSRPALLFG